MGTKKQGTKQRSIRLPEDLFDWVQEQAAAEHGGDFTAAIVTLLSRYRPYQDKELRWCKEGMAREVEGWRQGGEGITKEKDA